MLANKICKTNLEKLWIELSRIQVKWMQFSMYKASSGDSCYQSVLASTLVLAWWSAGVETSMARMKTGLANWRKRRGSAGEPSKDTLEDVN